ncbi:MAG: RIP metalloprotease RseP [Bacteroidaceae bacterium]|nr:RIP metalloprotease RseP [Bacteroidaceae bacterium]
MEIFLIRLLQFMLAISILVLLHEGGHFFFAKVFHVRVEKFYLFFDPWFHLFQFKPKHSDTTYGIGWLPLGGYCKIAGMIDESMDSEQMKQPAQPWEFRTKPAWQRLLIMIGGVLVNFLLALFIYSMVLFYWGDSYVPVKNMSIGMKFNQQAKEIGFHDGDILVNTDKKVFNRFDVDLYRNLSEAKSVTVIRSGKDVTINMPQKMSLLTMMKNDPPFVRVRVPAVIDSVLPNTVASKAGMKKGYRLVSLNGTPLDSWQAYEDVLGRINDVLTTVNTQKDSIKLRTISLVYSKQAGMANDTVNMVLTSDLKMGVVQSNYLNYYKTVQINYNFLESFTNGSKYGIHVLGGYVDDMKYVFTADGAKSLGGFGAIGSLFPPVWDWMMFWRMTAFLSIILAFMNILPIPALDGGHVLFLCYEIITRRKPSDNFMIRAEYIGMGLLILLMVVANLNDVLRWLGFM